MSQYAALEAWVHQLVVLAGKERWGWNPPTMGGNCVYRVAAVEELGGFPVNTSTEDIEVSLAPRWAAFVRSHRWHRSQESFVRAGRIHVRLRVRVCPEVVGWVLAFGPDVRVIGPPALGRRIARLARQMARLTSAAG